MTASGVPDAIDDDGLGEFREHWAHELSLSKLCRRDIGESALREFTQVVAQRYGLDPSCVTITSAASTAITQVLIALIRAGDHVVVERPTYEALRRAPELFGAMVSRLERRYDESWAVVPERLAQLLTSRTRAVILTNLHNPSGAAIDPDTLHVIAELASRVGAMVLVDEVYLDHLWPWDHSEARPAATLARNTVSWSSATKTFGFSALRSGWIITSDPDAARAIRAAADYLFVTPPVVTTHLGARVLEHAHALTARAKKMSDAGRRVVDAWLAHEPRLGWIPPAAGLTGLIRLPSFMSDITLCEHLRQRYDTQLVPGAMFEAPGFVRLSYGIGAELLEPALANISSSLDDLTR